MSQLAAVQSGGAVPAHCVIPRALEEPNNIGVGAYLPVALSVRERWETWLARRLLQLPQVIVRWLAGPPVERNGQRLDPGVQMILRIQNMAGPRPPERPALNESRRRFDVSANQLGPCSTLGVGVETTQLAGRPARRYTPRESRDGRGVLWLHGGGFVVGSLDSHDGVCRQVAHRLGAVVVALDYRLAPEHPFPAAADDATAGLRAFLGDASAHRVSPDRIAVAGDSAGGNLALLSALETRDDALRPAAVLAVYPGLDWTMSAPSHETLGKGFFLEAEDIRYYRTTYLNGADVREPRASPAFQSDLSRLPPTVLATSGFDPLRDEGDRFAAALREAGVPMNHLRFEGMFHGFFNCPAIRGAGRAIDATLDALHQLI